jgi:hypothetical protein
VGEGCKPFSARVFWRKASIGWDPVVVTVVERLGALRGRRDHQVSAVGTAVPPANASRAESAVR